MAVCGIDIIEISRIEDALKKTDGFLEKVFSAEEIAYYIKNGQKPQHLAGFYAAKEAFAKFLGTGISGFKLSGISVGHNPKGQPYVTFKGDVQQVSLSISHNKTTAVAVVCGDKALENYPKLEDAKVLLPNREKSANKGTFGRVLVVAGSKGMTGAAVMSAYSALRTGSGLVTLATADSERAIAAGFYPELMTYGLDSEKGIISAKALKDILRLSKKADAVIFGPGIGTSRDLTNVLEELLKNYTGKIVVDADGLNALAKHIEILNKKTCDVVLTPHPGEMARLTGLTIDAIQKNRQSVAMDFAESYGVCLVLKGFETVVAETGRDIYVNQTGNSGMATAGTGDVLSGVIGSLMGQGLAVYDAARLGVYLHGLAGDIAKDKLGEYSMTASDVMNNLSNAIKGVLM